MDHILASAKTDYLVQFRIDGRSISVLGENEGHMTLIDQDRLNKIKNVQLMERIFNIAKEIQEELKIK